MSKKYTVESVGLFALLIIGLALPFWAVGSIAAAATKDPGLKPIKPPVPPAPPVTAATIAGCQVDSNFPQNMQFVLQDLLTNPNYTSALLNQQAASYASVYPKISACLFTRAAEQAAKGM